MAAARVKKEKPPPGPDELVRESAGVYRTGDGRFEVQKSDVGWYLVDTEQANEFGQQLIHGPLATLDAIREAIPGARDLKPLLRVRPKKDAGKPVPSGKPAKPEPPPPPPPTWIDRLGAKEAADVRSLIRALEKEGLEDADELVRRHRDDTVPTIATRIVEHRLRALVDQQKEADRERARILVREVIDTLTAGGVSVAGPAPRWALVEMGDNDALPTRRIRPRLEGG